MSDNLTETLAHFFSRATDAEWSEMTEEQKKPHRHEAARLRDVLDRCGYQIAREDVLKRLIRSLSNMIEGGGKVDREQAISVLTDYGQLIGNIPTNQPESEEAGT